MSEKRAKINTTGLAVAVEFAALCAQSISDIFQSL
jgi:hypothetical protein